MNMCLETGSPRISYSLDFDQLDFIPVELTLPSLPPSSNPAFEFGARGSFEFEQSSAGELFENGMILPSDIQTSQASRCEEAQEQEVSPQPLPLLSPLHLVPSSHGEAMKQTAEENAIMSSRPKPVEKIQTKSFWGFKRSSSLDSENSKRLSFLFPLPVLSRSNSVSSAAASQKQRRRQSLKQQQPSIPRMTKSSSSSGYACVCPPDHISPLLRKSRSGGMYHGSSIVVAPVLNVLPRRTSRGTMNLFGFGCLSLWGKEKKSREDDSWTSVPRFADQCSNCRPQLIRPPCPPWTPAVFAEHEGFDSNHHIRGHVSSAEMVQYHFIFFCVGKQGQLTMFQVNVRRKWLETPRRFEPASSKILYTTASRQPRDQSIARRDGPLKTGEPLQNSYQSLWWCFYINELAIHLIIYQLTNRVPRSRIEVRTRLVWSWASGAGWVSLDHASIVGPAETTLVIHPMEAGGALLVAVIAHFFFFFLSNILSGLERETSFDHN